MSVSKHYLSVDVRQFWKPNNNNKTDVLPRRRGVPLKIQQHEAIKKSLEQLRESCHKLEDAQPCYKKVSHQNFIGLHQCIGWSLHLNMKNAAPVNVFLPEKKPETTGKANGNLNGLL